MPKSPPSRSAPRVPALLTRLPVRRVAVQILVLAALVFGGVAGYRSLRRYVDRQIAFPADPPQVVLKNRPPWMSDLLAEKIAATARPAAARSSFDQQLLIEAATLLKSNPWIRQVRQVRRAYGNRPGDTLEIDCEYRDPIGLVQWGDYAWLVDGQGYKLPEAFTANQVLRVVYGRDRRPHVRLIEGVRRPPPETGQKWQGDDLAAGIELVKLLYGRAAADQVLKVSVANFEGRQDPRQPQLLLVTRHNTILRWGRPVSARDFFVEVAPARKLAYIEQLVAATGRPDGGKAWIDLRFDRLLQPDDTSHARVQ